MDATREEMRRTRPRLRRGAAARVGTYVLLLASLVFGTARAQTSTSARHEEAKALLRAGAAQMQEGEYAAALSSFEQAYALVPSAKIHYNLGNAYAALARPAQAHEAFTRFLAEATDAPAEFKRNALARLEELRPKLGSVTVTTDREGAEITIDGRALGRAPLPRPVLLDPGPHSVIAKLGAASASESLTVRAGETRTVTLALGPPGLAAVGGPVPEAPRQPAALDVRAASADPPAPRFYQRVWFWGLIGAAVVGAGVAVALSSGGTTYPQRPDVQVQW